MVPKKSAGTDCVSTREAGKRYRQKPKAENKYIIMDCFTTWCGPCKHMDKNVFPLKETGDFFNDKFINVKVQFDSTADDEEVKSWKKDMKEIEKKYAINAYPTYLMFDPNGEVVHRAVGATPDAKGFIARGRMHLFPKRNIIRN
jgi:thioredoxin-related protein